MTVEATTTGPVGEQVRAVDLEDAELVAPGVTEDPEV
jgi:hypothetical protein